MTTYSREWRSRHPTPWDFFHTFERVSGRELDWFFYPWWFETGVLDQAIESVQPAGAAGPVDVTVRDLGDIPVPTRVVATTASGSTLRAEIPVETWLSGRREATVTLPATEPVVAVELDPELVFPDVDRGNDLWSAR